MPRCCCRRPMLRPRRSASRWATGRRPAVRSACRSGAFPILRCPIPCNLKTAITYEIPVSKRMFRSADRSLRGRARGLRRRRYQERRPAALLSDGRGHRSFDEFRVGHPDLLRPRAVQLLDCGHHARRQGLHVPSASRSVPIPAWSASRIRMPSIPVPTN